jgi:hypothetical protein
VQRRQDARAGVDARSCGLARNLITTEEPPIARRALALAARREES